LPAVLPETAGRRGPGATAMSGNPVPSLDHLRAEERYARERLALYRRRALLGRGDPRRLAELERIADGALKRLRHAEDAAG